MSDGAASALPAIFSRQRLVLLVVSVIVALCSGTNYVYSAYSPQLGERLGISHTQLNIIGLAGNVGVYLSGPMWGRVVDTRGPRFPFVAAFILLLSGYSGIRILFGAGLPPSVKSIPTLTVVLLATFSFMTGSGGNAGVTGGLNSTAKSFPDRARATTAGLVLSGFGLSAFLFSTIAHTAYPGDTGEFLVVLALGTSLPMILGLIFVRPIPLPASELSHGAAYEELEAEAAAAGVAIHPDESQTHLLTSSDEEDLAGSVELSPPRNSARRRSTGTRRGSSTQKRVEDGHALHGLLLVKSLDFWLLFSTLSLLSGTGLMYINNVGSMSQALYAKDNPKYDAKEALRWQSTQVSTVSLFNFAGRIFLGLVSDFTKNKLKQPRSYCMVLVSFMVLASQLLIGYIDHVKDLWIASMVLGLSYGSVFALFPTVCIEWFGLAHFSENWGYTSLSPMVGGNLFSIAFGRNLDAHEPQQTATDSPGTSSRQCLLGKACYIDSLKLTIAGCALALALSVWAGWRDRKRAMLATKEAGVRSARARTETVWEHPDA